MNSKLFQYSEIAESFYKSVLIKSYITNLYNICPVRTNENIWAKIISFTCYRLKTRKNISGRTYVRCSRVSPRAICSDDFIKLCIFQFLTLSLQFIFYCSSRYPPLLGYSVTVVSTNCFFNTLIVALLLSWKNWIFIGPLWSTLKLESMTWRLD